MLKIVLDNLMDNAIKFSSNVPKPRVEFGITKFSDKEAYFVKDNGVGFDMDYANKLFAPFVKLHMDGEFHGTGIGLAMVQRIIRRHGGEVWAEGKIGTRCHVLFYLKLNSRKIKN